MKKTTIAGIFFTTVVIALVLLLFRFEKKPSAEMPVNSTDSVDLLHMLPVYGTQIYKVGSPGSRTTNCSLFLIGKAFHPGTVNLAALDSSLNSILLKYH
jgi:hypothetical protein